MISIKITSFTVNVYNFTVKISKGEIKFEEIIIWLKKNSTAIQ